MPTTKLLPGTYPQLSEKYTRINSTIWTEKTTKSHGHTLLYLKPFELTLISIGKTESYKMTKKQSPIKEVEYATIKSSTRSSNQFKARVTFDMHLITMTEVERVLRAEIDMYGKRVGIDIPLVVEWMVTMKKGLKCTWKNFYKEGEGEVMVLTHVNDKSIGKMEKEDAMACLSLGWEDDVCEVKKGNVAVKEIRSVCGNSNLTIKKLRQPRKGY